MKKLINKNFTQKIIIAIVIVLSFNFVAPTFSRADFGGVLLGPVIDLIAGIGDSVMALLQVFMDGGENKLLSSEGFLVKSDDFRGNEASYGMSQDSTSQSKTINSSELDQGWFGWGTYSIPIIKYSPEKIFANDVPALDANFINPKPYTGTQADKSIALQLQETIASWYNALRNLVVVGLLSILVYVGIKMMLTSVSADKAKYKQMFLDWLIALCLVFFLHYIMSFTMTVTQMVTDGISGGTDVNVTINDTDKGNITYRTNLTGLCRMQVQYKDLGTRMVYLIFYIALVVYTFMFTWKYMKRAITMAFLTLMAPLVTLTYPIDKMGDGKAQAFNMWIKEYVFNALLQPFHLIIYTIFLGSAMNVAIENPLYAILFLAFITPAEKILRKFFGFEKASTAGGTSFAGGFGGAAAFNAMKNTMNRLTKGANQRQGGGNNNNRGIRQQSQVTDPNAPDGSLGSFTGTGAGANGGEEGNNPPTTPDELPSPALSLEEQQEKEALQQELDNADYNDMYLNPENYQAKQDRLDELTARQQEADRQRQEEEARRQAEEQAQQQAQQQQPQRATRQVRQGQQSVRQMAQRQQNGQRQGRRPSRIRGVLGVAGHMGAGALRLGGRAVAAGAVGAIGLGMGIAGDNLEDVFTYGLGGAALGATVVPQIPGAVVDGVTSAVNDIRDTYISSAYGGGAAGRTQVALDRQDREFRANQENRDFFETAIEEQTGSRPSREELNETMRVASQYNNAGITDLKQINKSMKLEKELSQQLQESGGMTEEDATAKAREQAMTIAQIAKGIDAKELRQNPEKIQEQFVRGLKKSDPSMSDRDASAQADRILEMVKKQKKVD